MVDNGPQEPDMLTHRLVEKLLDQKLLRSRATPLIPFKLKHIHPPSLITTPSSFHPPIIIPHPPVLIHSSSFPHPCSDPFIFSFLVPSSLPTSLHPAFLPSFHPPTSTLLSSLHPLFPPSLIPSSSVWRVTSCVSPSRYKG